MNSKHMLFAFLVTIINVLQMTHGDEDVSETILENVLKSYNKELYPNPDTPLEDRIGIYINGFSISDVDMSYQMTFYLRQSWKDQRLNFEKSTVDSWDDIPESIKKGILNTEKFRASPDTVKELFIPDLFFRNSASVDELNLDMISHENTLAKINKTGHMWYVRKLTASFSCPMKFQKFPFDTQMCPLMFESFGETMDNLYFNWLDSPVDVDPVIQLPRFTLTDIVLHDCSQNYTAGAFPCLEIRFVLRRDAGYYILQGFIPSTLAVFMSWFMLWTDMESGLKVILGVILMASLVSLDSQLTQSLPYVSYIKCIDIWFAACTIMVLLATIISVRIAKTRDDGGKRFSGPKLEKVARIALPIIFLIFTVIFVILYSAI